MKRKKDLEDMVNIGARQIVALIKKYEESKEILAEHLLYYRENGNQVEYDSTFRTWNNVKIFIEDLEDVLYRMGIERD